MPIFLTSGQVRDRFGKISDMTLWRWINDEHLGFPKPSIIKRRRYFLLTDIENFEQKVRNQGAIA